MLRKIAYLAAAAALMTAFAAQAQDAMPGPQVGEITSSARGYSVDEVLGLGFVQASHAWPGNQLLVEVNGRPKVAKVVSTPFFDPDNARPRSLGSRKETQ